MALLGAAGLLLRRLREERGIAILIFVLVAATSFVFAAAPRLFDRVSDAALRHEARVAPPTQRNLTLTVADSIDPGADGGVAGVREHGEDVASDFPASVDAVISERTLSVTTVRLYVPEPPSYETHLTLRYQDGVTDATTLVEGRWPTDRGMPLQLDDPDAGGGPQGTAIFEAALSSATATGIGVGIGDRLGVTLDGSDSLIIATRFKIAPTQIEIVGIYQPLDADAEIWSGNLGLLQVAQMGDEEHPIAFATAYVAPEAYARLWASTLP